MRKRQRKKNLKKALARYDIDAFWTLAEGTSLNPAVVIIKTSIARIIKG